MISLLLATFLGLSFSTDFTAFKYIPVQDAGREKPFDTFARESMQLIYGRTKYKNAEGRKLEATEVVITWMIFPDVWQDTKIIEINHRAIKDSLKLDTNRKYFSLRELSSNDRLPTFFQELNIRVEGKEKLDSFFQGMQRISNQMSVLSAILQGQLPGFIPQEGGWKSLAEMSDEDKELFRPVAESFVNAIANQSDPSKDKIQAYIAKIYEKSDAGLKRKIVTEVHFNELHPFMWVWITLLIATICCFLFWILKKKVFLHSAFALNIFALVLGAYGFLLRIYLTGRPPVSNMYESVIWVAWGTLFFALIFYFLKKNQYVLFASSLMGGLCFMVADFAPNVLDPSLQPLEPVLRSNLWLTVHVLTITISYSAFLLSFGLSDFGLFYYLRPPKDAKKKIKAMADASYRAIQIGVVLLAAGTILGGVWADYSWGRFWGWDPKETWALIALLGYLALLHARLAGLLKSFGMFVGSIVSFSLVIMAWYGVNFVLGAGLHSYGFGGGGIEYVTGFVFVHMLYVLFVYMNKKDIAA